MSKSYINNRIMSFKAPTLLWCIIWLCLLQVSLGDDVQHPSYKFDIEYFNHKPDCIEHVVMGINGQFPGPTIRAQVGDTLNIAVTNKLTTEGTVIHWHGIRQYGTPWADGTASVSQCAIEPGQTFHYKFKVDKAGTYLYHGHYGMQRSAGLYGFLIVDLTKEQKEPFHYDEEFNLLLSDWWHKSSLDQEVDLSSKPMKWIYEPQSLLINGRGQYGCSMAAELIKTSLAKCDFRDNEQCAPQFFHVDPNKTYRVRIASATSLSALNLAIAAPYFWAHGLRINLPTHSWREDHKMKVVEADGNYVEPFVVDNIDIYSGESYSVLLTTDQDQNKNYWISVGVRGRKPDTPQALTILNYKTTSASNLPTSPPPITPQWDDYQQSKSFTQKILASDVTEQPPKHYDRRLLLLNTQNYVDGYTKWAINNVSLALPSTPYLASVKLRLDNNRAIDPKQSPPDSFPESYDILSPPLNPNATIGSGVYMFKHKQVVDVILQNANVLSAKSSEIHPWHLHGHDFWVLGYGEGKFEQGDEAKFNLKNPPLRNTAVIFPYGWTALRFKADNPGVWAFHCHIEPHLHMGMGVIFVEAVKILNGLHVPKEAIACGRAKEILINKKHN